MVGGQIELENNLMIYLPKLCSRRLSEKGGNS